MSKQTSILFTNNKQQVYGDACLQTTNNKYTAMLVYKQQTRSKQAQLQGVAGAPVS